ncbi:MAG: branched-chain amino acid ABC transporter permease, partial [Pseudomonadota bacterium]|nr:branched-chain amino acid ABC transporter permease [Pseudomonadota bacterium]
MGNRAQILIVGTIFLGLALVPLFAELTQTPFYLDLARRMMILAIGALSLNLIMGYGGLISFGHAAYIGIGAY